MRKTILMVLAAVILCLPTMAGRRPPGGPIIVIRPDPGCHWTAEEMLARSREAWPICRAIADQLGGEGGLTCTPDEGCSCYVFPRFGGRTVYTTD